MLRVCSEWVVRLNLGGIDLFGLSEAASQYALRHASNLAGT